MATATAEASSDARDVIFRTVALSPDVTHACRNAPGQGQIVCDTAFDGCTSIDNAVFCDARWAKRVRVFASLVRRAVALTLDYHQQPPTIQPDALMPKELLSQYLDYWQRIRSTSDLDSIPAPDDLAEQHSAVADSLALALVGFALGHELSHVQQRLCPSDIKLPGKTADEYRTLTCGDTSTLEFIADVAGVYRTGHVAERLKPADEISFSALLGGDRGKLADIWMEEHWDQALATAITDFAEASVVFSTFGAQAAEIVRAEPSLAAGPTTPEEKAMAEAARWKSNVLGDENTDKGLLLESYYETKARQAQISVSEYEHHLPAAYRFYLLQSVVAGSDIDVDHGQGMVRTRGLRFSGLLRQLVYDMQQACPNRGAETKHRIASDWIGGTLAGQTPTFARGNALACDSKDALKNARAKLATNSIDLQTLLRHCGFPAAWRVKVLRREGDVAQVELAGQPTPYWMEATQLSRCPEPTPHNSFMDKDSPPDAICVRIATEVFREGGGRLGAGVRAVASSVAAASSTAMSAAERDEVTHGDYCLTVEWRGKSCVAALDLQGIERACPLNTKKYNECFWTKVETHQESECLVDLCEKP